MIDKTQMKNLMKGMDEAKKLAESTLHGIPDRIAAYKNVTADEAKLLGLAMTKFDSVNGDLDKEMADFKKILKL